MTAPNEPPAPPKRGALVATVVAVVAAMVLATIGVVVAARSHSDEPEALETPLACTGVAGLDGGLVGFSPGSGFESGDDADGDAAAMAATGAGWIRLDLDWSWVERTRGAPDWTASDRSVDLARRNGLRVLFLVAYTPEWARPAGTTDKHPPRRLEDFAAFVSSAVRRYRGQVEAWELWNEPNLSTFWAPAPDAAGFAALVRAGTVAIRRLEPDAVVVSGGLAPAADLDDGSERSPERFLAEVADAGGLEGVDGVGIHPYSAPGLPSGTQPWNLFNRLPGLRDLVAERTGRSIPLWLTEYGLPAGDNSRAVSERVQARGIVEAVTLAQRMDGIGPLFVYADRDRPDRSSGIADGGGFGLRRTDGSPRPSYRALRNALRCPPG
jgi:hypothetical protein